MNAFEIIAENRIREALDNGDFDNLSLCGQPLDLDDGQFVPLHLRLCQRILKNAGILPPVLQLKKEIIQLSERLAQTEDEGVRESIKRCLFEKTLRHDVLMEQQKKVS
ncbi:MAG: DUF1992 domain-containing protein [Proteobacteria bacterium]|jgi:hypothetical protein|nr:DUF1992 domain-containing protein [Pseudomonadota bacterium]